MQLPTQTLLGPEGVAYTLMRNVDDVNVTTIPLCGLENFTQVSLRSFSFTAEPHTYYIHTDMILFVLPKVPKPKQSSHSISLSECIDGAAASRP